MSDDMNDDKLNRLRDTATPAPRAAARQRALDAAMLAFDAAQQDSTARTQGTPAAPRLKSIFHLFKGNWIMDTRFSLGLGTAAVALLLLPLGYQLYSTTAMTPLGFDARQPAGPVVLERAEESREDDNAAVPPMLASEEAAPAEVGPLTAVDEMTATSDPMMAAEGEAQVTQRAVSGLADTSTAKAMPAPLAAQDFAAGGTSVSNSVVASPRDRAMLPQAEPSGDDFTDFDESPLKLVADEPVSTFSIDVDTASYSYVRRLLNDGYLPDPDSVRIEEMINYFDYDYATPDNAAQPFQPSVQIYPTPWNAKTQLMQIGIKGYVPAAAEDKPSNLVFLLDTSGSMEAPDKLPLLKRAFALLAGQLGENDTVSIVAYAGSAGVVLEPTKATDKATILAALDNLAAGGSTAGADGIELAYQLAAGNKVEGGINRVILATDGDFNVGIDDPEDLEEFIKVKRDQGISLSVLGFGMGNYGDDTMQALAQNGNGNASYIDSFKEAHKVLVQELGGTLETIAKDVKIQVEFNPAVVSEYRLVGYETRALNREDFNNDKVDAGDIGAGHTVTAIYEITPVGSGGELVDPLRYGTDTPAVTLPNRVDSAEIGFLKLRYKLPEGTESTLIETPITEALAVDTIDEASTDSRWAAAVAAFAQKLKRSSYAGEMTYADIRDLAQGARGDDENGYRAEFIQLINAAASFDPDPLCTAPEGARNCR